MKQILKLKLEKQAKLDYLRKDSNTSTDNSVLSSGHSTSKTNRKSLLNTIIQNKSITLNTSTNLKDSLKLNLANSFKIKIPFFPKRPFGKHSNPNDTEMNFVEIDVSDKTHNLYEKHSKYYKIVCGRAYSVGIVCPI